MVYALSVQEFYLYLFIELDVLSNLNTLPDLIVVVGVESLVKRFFIQI